MAKYKKELPLAEITNDDLKKIQAKSLEILLYFKEICDKHSLLFYFCGGCCIGTLRNQGFIPWDDDVDVFMPRDDYEKLKVVWKEEADPEKYTCVTTDRDNYSRMLFATYNDNHTTFIKQRQVDVDTNHGFRVEVLPLDGCPDSRFKRRMQMMWALLYSMFISGEAPTSKGLALRIIGNILLVLFSTKGLRYRAWRFCEKRMSRFKWQDCSRVTELCARFVYMGNEYPREAFDSAVYKEFEGHMMPIPVGYDAYLTMAFGDYMTPPPPEKQVAKHEIVYYNTEEGYEQYKGSYYCVPEK